MAKSPHELPADSLASLDASGNRIFIYPAQVKGLWHQRRLILQMILLAIFLAIPWIKIGGAPAILLNLPERRFAIFGLTFWAHDGPIIFFVLTISALSLVLATAIWGRIWCGWACPQTVFIEQVYRRLETWIEGSHLERRKLNEGPLTLSKVVKKLTKWSAFGVVSWLIGNTFLAYFVGTDRLLTMIQTSPSENWTSFLVMAFVTAVVWFDFGWFREQFCIIMCPYGRFQSALMDRHSTAVIYDHHRGEPRKGSPEFGEKKGDCVNCFKCVAVCPTAIDIRRGVQMECIACTACIDACDEVMEKIKKPTGLIRYGSEVELDGKTRHRWRARVALYSVLLVILASGFAVALSKREEVPVTILRGIDTPYRPVKLSDGRDGLVNHFQIVMENHHFSPVQIQIEIANAPEGLRLISPLSVFSLKSGENQRQHVFVEFPKDLTLASGRMDLPIQLKIIEGESVEARNEVFHLVGPTQ